MKRLQAYLDRENAYMAIFGRPPLTTLTPESRQQIAHRLDSQLSPENLTCDGELSRSQVNQRYSELTAVARELVKLDTRVTFCEYSEA